MKSHVGLFFGTFNPVHVGHMIIAQHMLEYSDMDQLWFMVTPHNPHKKKSTLLDDRQRLHMVDLAIVDHVRMKASDEEFHLPQPSYTITTLTHLSEKYPDKKFSLIMGMDNLESFHKWKNFDKIIEQHDIYVYPRPGHDGGQFGTHPKVHVIDAPNMEISATRIRESLRDGKDLSYMVPNKVWEYLETSGFYR
ncbi:MAG: nicotinate-nucleotide adenylyltransferase [Flavobacteriia bacterium]|nr:nicotinate-nucleotide adenylyltransferase [Flavobacteriia bacterium]